MVHLRGGGEFRAKNVGDAWKPVLGSCPDSPLALQKRNDRQPKDGALLYLAVGLAIQAKNAFF